MNQPTDHELNQCLAEVAGVEIKKHVEGNPIGPEIRSGWVHLKRKTKYGEHWDWWNPLRDANQMETVEEALLKAGMLCKIGWYGTQWEAWIGTKIDPMGPADGEFRFNKDKKRAFALAVWAMVQSQKGTT